MDHGDLFPSARFLTATMTLLLRHLVCWACLVGAAPLVGRDGGEGSQFVLATDPRLHFSDGLHVLRHDQGGSVSFDRVIDVPGRGFRWDSPGARVRWRTDSPSVRVRLRYSARHTGTSRQSVGVFRVDGRSDPAWTFTRPAPGNAGLWVTLPAGPGRSWHDYELILPYGDALDVLGVEVAAEAAWAPAPPRPATRYVAFGDSVTHGFTATDVTKTYAFQVAERNGWQLINLGIGGRGTSGADGAFLAGVNADVISVLIGVNDWQGGAALGTFRTHYARLVADLRRGHPAVPVFLITPLWVPPTWSPAAARYPLEQYRSVIREVAAAAADPLLTVIEGPALITHDAACFDAIAVHPNDAGFALMAERLASAMRPRPE